MHPFWRQATLTFSSTGVTVELWLVKNKSKVLCYQFNRGTGNKYSGIECQEFICTQSPKHRAAVRTFAGAASTRSLLSFSPYVSLVQKWCLSCFSASCMLWRVRTSEGLCV